jgi:alanine dehydrogenase
MRFDASISLGHLLQAAALITALSFWIITGASKTDAVRAELTALQGQVAAQAAQTRSDIRDSLARVETGVEGLRGQVAALPDLGAKVTQLDRSVIRLEERAGVQDGRIDIVRQTATELRVEFDLLRRASMASLPGARGIRQ